MRERRLLQCAVPLSRRLPGPRRTAPSKCSLIDAPAWCSGSPFMLTNSVIVSPRFSSRTVLGAPRSKQMSCVVSPLLRRYCSAVSPVPCIAASAYIESGSSVCRNISSALRCGSMRTSRRQLDVRGQRDDRPTPSSTPCGMHRSPPTDPIPRRQPCIRRWPGRTKPCWGDSLCQCRIPFKLPNPRPLPPFFPVQIPCPAHQSHNRSNNRKPSCNLQWESSAIDPFTLRHTGFRTLPQNRS